MMCDSCAPKLSDATKPLTFEEWWTATVKWLHIETMLPEQVARLGYDFGVTEKATPLDVDYIDGYVCRDCVRKYRDGHICECDITIYRTDEIGHKGVALPCRVLLQPPVGTSLPLDPETVDWDMRIEDPPPRKSEEFVLVRKVDLERVKRYVEGQLCVCKIGVNFTTIGDREPIVVTKWADDPCERCQLVSQWGGNTSGHPKLVEVINAD